MKVSIKYKKIRKNSTIKKDVPLENYSKMIRNK